LEKNILKKARAPNLTDERVEKIVKIIDSWSDRKLTWAGIITVVELKLGATYTRQALSKNPRIQIAYETKSERLR
jgi:hypothetical protein